MVFQGAKIKKAFLAVILFAGCVVFAFSQASIAANIARGDVLADELARVLTSAANGTRHIIEISGDIEITSRRLTLPARGGGITITLHGGGAARTINLAGEGSLFIVGSGVTLILAENITLRGGGDNRSALVQVNSGGALVMNVGSEITGNTGGGVLNWGAFTMYGGAIFNNTGADGVGGDHDYHRDGSRVPAGTVGGVTNWGTFVMREGTISNNVGGSGVNGSLGGSGAVFNAGAFTMYGGTISANSGGSGGANRWGVRGGTGGVNNTGRFTMRDGVISGNNGGFGEGGWGGVGGVSNSGVFFLYGGTISGNSGDADGGDLGGPWGGWSGVGAVFSVGAFTMNGGTISGNNGGVGIWSVRYGVTTYGIFRVTNGIIYGNDAPENLENIGGALRIFRVPATVTTAQRGRFNNVGLFVPLGDLGDSDTTIYVVDGVIASP